MEKVEWVGVCVPVCCAWEQTVRMSISAPVWSMCVTLCLSDGQSKHPWVGAVCASLSRCSALQWVTWLLCSSPHCSLCTLSYLASFVCPPPPSFYLYPVVFPPIVPLPCLPSILPTPLSALISHPPILEPIDLQSEWASTGRYPTAWPCKAQRRGGAEVVGGEVNR